MLHREDGRRAAGRARQGRPCNLWPYHSKRTHDEAKRLADRAVANAIRLGTLLRLPCEVCGAEQSEAHHANYNLPLDVVWLCRPHHRERDKTKVPDTGERQEVRQQTYNCRPRVGLPFMTQVTEALLAHVHEQGWTQRELGRMCGVSQVQVHKWFAAGFHSFERAAQVADLLGVDLNVTATPRQRQSQSA